MKFLLLYPASSTASYNVVNYMARALNQLGHLVYLSHPKAMRRSAVLFRPDVLMVFFGIGIDMEEVRYIKRRGVITVFWGGDEEDWFHYYIRISPEFDLWCCYSTATLYAHQQAGARAIYFPYAADPALFFPVRLKREEKGAFDADIAFVGCHYPEREAIFRHLSNWYKVKAHYTGRESEEVPVEQIDFERLRKIYAGAKIVLDPFGTCDRQRSGLLGSKRSYGVPCRTFEVPACRAFGLQPFREDLPLLYDIGKEVDVFHDEEEMMDKISFYMKNPQKREDLAKKAYFRTLREHTYEHRAKTLLNAIEKVMQSLVFMGKTDASTSPEVSIVMPVFNGLDYTRQSIDSLIRYTSIPYELIVIDNGSIDGTWDYLRKLKKGGNLICLKVIRNPRNLGFPKACNQGIAQAQGRYIIILNNDVIVTEGWLEGLIRCMEADQRVGLVGPMTNYVSGRQLVQKVPYRTEEEMHRFAKKYAEEHHGEREEVERLVAFCLLVKREVFEKIGMFDEQFGIGNFEDDDLCLRARLAGFKAVIARDVFVHHHGSRTFAEMGLDYKDLMSKNLRRFKEKWRAFSKGEATRMTEEAACLWQEGREKEAIALSKRALEVDPTCAQAYNNLASMYWQLGEVKDALQHLQRAMELEPDDEDVVWNCGQMMLMLGKVEDARDIYKAYLQKHPEAKEIEEVLQHMERLIRCYEAPKPNAAQKRVRS